MDYGGIVKRAWSITWRYKILWLFGLFAGSGISSSNGSGGGSGTNYSTDYGDLQNLGVSTSGQDFLSWLEANLVLIIVLALFIMCIVIALWIISIAARGGLIHLVNEAAEERPVRAGAGWAVGFQYWGRLFLVRFLLYLPLAVVVIAGLAIAIVPLAMTTSSGSDASAGGILGVCGGLALLFFAILILGFVVGLIDEFAERHVVLSDMTAIEGIKAGWTNLKTRFKDSLFMWLIQLGFGFGFSITVVVLVVILAIPAVVVGVAAGVFGGIFVGFLAFLVLLVPIAAFSTFSSAMWTIFWRRLTGRELIEAPAPHYDPSAAIPAPPAGFSDSPAPPPPAPPLPPQA